MPLHIFSIISAKLQFRSFYITSSCNKTQSTQKCIKINNNTNLDKRCSNIDSHASSRNVKLYFQFRQKKKLRIPYERRSKSN